MGVPADNVAEWPGKIEQWTDAYQRAMGEKLAFLQADVVWRRASWQAMLAAATPILQRREIPLGIVYNGTPDDKSDSRLGIGCRGPLQNRRRSTPYRAGSSRISIVDGVPDGATSRNESFIVDRLDR